MLRVYTLKDCDEWDKIVSSFKNYDVYYLSGYTKAFYLHGDGEPLFFFYEDENIKAINVAMKRDISYDKNFNNLEKDKYFDLTTPYGYGGWLIEGDDNIDNLIIEYSNWCKENLIISEVVRFHPILANQEKMKNFYDVMDLGKTISIDTSSNDVIWSNFTTQNRGKIKKAMNYGVTIKHGVNSQILKEFKHIYNITMNKDNADDYYYFEDDFYQSIINDLNKNSDIFYAEYNGKIVASTIILKCNKKLTYHFSGVLTDYRYLQATNLMLYQIALWGAENGYRSFHLGGGVGSKEDNLYEFKKSFNKKDNYQYSIGKIIFNQELYDELVSMRKDDILRDNFFPQYRA